MTAPGRNLYHSIFWRLLLDVASRGVFFAVNVLIARTLSVSDFGFFSVAVSLSQVFYIFTDIGTHLQLMKELGGRRTQSPYHWVGFFQLKILLFVLSFLAFLVFVPFSWKWDRYWLPIIAFVWMSSNSLLDFEQFVCNGLGRMDLARKLMLVHRGFLLLGVSVPLLFFKSLPAVSVGLLFGSLFGMLFSNLIFFRDVQPQNIWTWNWAEWRRIVRLSLPLGIGGAFGSWYLRLGMIVLGYVATAALAGEYAAAFRIFEITYIIPAAVMSIGVPHLAEAYENGRKVFFEELKKISRLMVLGGLLWWGSS
jgi:O-antigen/teichoic acid export membrane protein